MEDYFFPAAIALYSNLASLVLIRNGVITLKDLRSVILTLIDTDCFSLEPGERTFMEHHWTDDKRIYD